MSKYGHEVAIASSGEKALDLVSQEYPDLIILDLGLPDMDGQTLLGILRREFLKQKSPIIVCTAWPPDSAKRMAEAYGFDDYICKPYQVAEFMKVVNQAIK